jgi:23S rRNA (adenine2503-C2)-methyltransferase
MESIYSLTLEDLEEFLLNRESKKFVAKQLYNWLYQNFIGSYEEIKNVKKETIDLLKENFYISSLELVKKMVSEDKTEKYLFRLSDDSLIETVLMRHNYGLSVCVSTQVGCNMGCAFCASGLKGKVRNLKAGEIVEQVIKVQKELVKNNERLSHVVIMGIGEPFDNYENVLKFIKIINNPLGLGIGARHITVSTCGIVPKIYEFSDFPLQVNLAISLHAPNNEIRNKLMRINKVYPIEEIIKAVRYYIKKTNRRVTFEYILLHDINDSLEHAKELAKLISGLNAYVNLIPYNDVAETGFKRALKTRYLEFYDVLKKHGISATIRREKGSDINAACGQLRINEMRK